MSCPSCGSPLGAASGAGTCSGCAIANALDSPRAGLELSPRTVGGYELGEQLGRGGMGVVYRARKAGVERDVALKMILAGADASFDEVRRFELEAEAAATLEHPNIVPVYEVGEHDGLPWFAMRLLEGGSLASRRDELSSPRAAARLVSTIAKAVRFGHRRGVIHRDLKPDNILFDEHGTPYVADFGISRRLGDGAQRELAGTPGYLAPEAAEGVVTTQADVYSLGAILFELLTGAAPGVDAAAPRPTGAPADLAAICGKALEPNLERRYPSADALALDLDAFLDGSAVSARRLSPPARALRWMGAHPFVSAAALFVLAAVAVTTTTATELTRRQERELQEEALAANTFAAQALAGAVLYELTEHARALDGVAAEVGKNPDALAAGRARYGFHSWLQLDPAGVVVARSPVAAFIGTSKASRDYFAGARRRAAGTKHVAEAFISEDDDTLRFALSAPLHDGAGNFLGVVAATLAADRNLGPLRAGDDSQRVAVLAARVESSDDIVALVHPRIQPTKVMTLGSAPLKALLARGPDDEEWRTTSHATASDAAYRDGDAEWLAGMARIGRTPLAVIVQTKQERAVRPSRVFLQRFAERGLLPVAALLLIAAVLAWVVRRRQLHA